MLDFYYEKAVRKIENDILSARAKSAEILKPGSRTPEIDTTLKNTFNNLKGSLDLRHQFDEYIIRYLLKLKGNCEDNENDSTTNKSKFAHCDSALHSSLLGLSQFPDSLLMKGGPLNTGVAIPIATNGEDYQFYGRQYTFESQFDKHVKIQIDIAGLVNANRYNAETRTLDPWVIILLSCFLILCLFGLPFFKMAFISENERLFSRDVILAGVSLILGTSLVIVVFLSMSSYVADYYFEVPEHLEHLSLSIKSRFEKENKDIVQGIYNINWAEYDSLAWDKDQENWKDKSDQWKEDSIVWNKKAFKWEDNSKIRNKSSAVWEKDHATWKEDSITWKEDSITWKEAHSAWKRESEKWTEFSIVWSENYRIGKRKERLWQQGFNSQNLDSLFWLKQAKAWRSDSINWDKEKAISHLDPIRQKVYEKWRNDYTEWEKHFIAWREEYDVWNTNFEAWQKKYNQWKKNNSILKIDSLHYKDFSAYGSPPFIGPITTDSFLRYNFKYVSNVDKDGKICYSINLLKAPPPGDVPASLKDRTYYKDFFSPINVWEIQVDSIYRKDDLVYVTHPDSVFIQHACVDIDSADFELVYGVKKKRELKDSHSTGGIILNNQFRQNIMNDSAFLRSASVKYPLAGRRYTEVIYCKRVSVKYVMRPVVSIENGTEEAVYMLSDQGKNYKVGSVQLRSLHDPILAFGYQFAVIDNNGEVWFHSESGKSTLENFYTISGSNNDLKGAVHGRVAVGGSLKYHDDGLMYHVRPIKGTNLSVVALYDSSLLGVRTSEVLSITSIAILLFFLILGSITIIYVFTKKPYQPIFKYRPFLFEFLTPKSEYIKTYKDLSFTFLILIGVLIIANILNLNNSPTIYIASILLALWSFLLVYIALHTNQGGKVISEHTKARVRFLLGAIFASGIWIALPIGQSSPAIFTSITIQLICSYFIFRLVGQLPKDRKERQAKEKATEKGASLLKQHYIQFLFIWLVLVAIFPAILFYQSIKKADDAVWVGINHLHLAQAYAAKEEILASKLEPDSINKPLFKDVIYQNHLSGGLYSYEKDVISKVSISQSQPGDSISETSKLFQEQLWRIRPIYDTKLRPFQAMTFQKAADGSWAKDAKSNSLDLRAGNYTIRVEGLNSEQDLGSGHHETTSYLPKAIKWGGIGAISLLLYILLSFYVDRCFGFKFKDIGVIAYNRNKGPERKDKEAGPTQKWMNLLKPKSTTDAPFNKPVIPGLFLIGLPHSGKSEFVADIISKYDKPVSISFLRWHNISDVNDIGSIYNGLAVNANGDVPKLITISNADIIILEHLECNMKSFDCNRVKLKILSYLLSINKPMILTSEVYPSQIFGHYLDYNKGKKQDNEKTTSNKDLASDYYSWRDILSSFPQILVGLTSNTGNIKSNARKQEGASKILDVFEVSGEGEDTQMDELYSELDFGTFLPKLQPVLLSKLAIKNFNSAEGDSTIDEDQIVVQIQSLSYGYYTDIWNSLPSREQYMLYDLAKDGFTNTKDSSSLTSLMRKGLIVWRDRLTIFNQSFRNFVASSVTEAEALSVERKHRGQGSWSTMRTVIYLIILAIIVFIVMGKPGLMDDFETFYGVLAGFGATLPLMSRMLSFGSAK